VNAYHEINQNNTAFRGEALLAGILHLRPGTLNRPWSSFSPPNVECGDLSPLSEPCGDESPHSTNSPIGLNDDQGRLISYPYLVAKLT